ncbi:hypothetical protein COV19_03240 [Candidatus Woesearchaeota archaeon CG10_big_fil_rev_8_21_14_0_10_44_13]|nr:MAG: hypothetical protein COV19_03240 [Candidatus Woesearchaeota archaeon CG10_big_fil_rev_8_21_14_0_10_44_13]
MIPENEINRIKEELDNCKRPLFFFHDDADGLSSFLLLYRYKNEGKGVVVKTHPRMDIRSVRKVTEYQPDKIFILDVPIVEQDFFDNVLKMKIPTIWIDHHDPADVKGILYFNPRKHNPKDDACITRVCYEVVKQDLWIEMTGSVGDWQKSSHWDEFAEKYPNLLPKEIKNQEDALFRSRLGELVKIFSFVLKGKTEDIINCMKVLTRVKDPYEILDRTTSQGNFVYKRYEKIKTYYDELLQNALHRVRKGKFFIFVYKGERFSFSSELANEILYRNPSKIILVGREKGGEIKYSIRGSHILIPPILKKALEGTSGYGGGHEHACGACVKADENERFIDQFKKAL